MQHGVSLWPLFEATTHNLACRREGPLIARECASQLIDIRFGDGDAHLGSGSDQLVDEFARIIVRRQHRMRMGVQYRQMERVVPVI